MNKLKLWWVAVLISFCVAAKAQDTNNLKTELGVFEARTGVVLVKGIGQIGSIPIGSGEIDVRYKETLDVGTGHKVYGLVVEIEANPEYRQRILVDDDEIDALLNALNYLININSKVTTLPAFEASYTTKAELRLLATSFRRDGGILSYLQYDDTPRISLSSVQMTQLYGLIEQARKNLDALKAAN